jgi:hypothetical protein
LAQADSLLAAGRKIRQLLKLVPKSQITPDNTSYRTRMSVAAECFSLVNNIKPNDPHALIEWGKLLMQAGSLNTAKEKLELVWLVFIYFTNLYHSETLLSLIFICFRR